MEPCAEASHLALQTRVADTSAQGLTVCRSAQHNTALDDGGGHAQRHWARTAIWPWVSSQLCALRELCAPQKPYKAAWPTACQGAGIMCSRAQACISPAFNQRIKLSFASEPNSVWIERHQARGHLPGTNLKGSVTEWLTIITIIISKLSYKLKRELSFIEHLPCVRCFKYIHEPWGNILFIKPRLMAPKLCCTLNHSIFFFLIWMTGSNPPQISDWLGTRCNLVLGLLKDLQVIQECIDRTLLAQSFGSWKRTQAGLGEIRSERLSFTSSPNSSWLP